MAEHAWEVYQEADCLYDEAQVEEALDRMAAEITSRLAGTNPLILTVMNGAVVTAGKLATRLNFPLEMDYIHATRYRGDTRGGGIHWKREPGTELRGRTVLVVDDILDEGHTLAAILDYCQEQGAARVYSAVLVDKRHDRKARTGMRADFTGLETEDRYLFGYGLDYKEYLRNAPGIYAVKGM